jgi:hypothetical protein
MVRTKDPVLIVWEAMNLLTEVDRLAELPEISKIRADAEMILIHLITELVQHSDNRDSPGLAGLRPPKRTDAPRPALIPIPTSGGAVRGHGSRPGRLR